MKASSRRAGSMTRSVTAAPWIAARKPEGAPPNWPGGAAPWVEADVSEAGYALQVRSAPAQPHLHPTAAPCQQRSDVTERDQLAPTDDGHAVADALHLGQDVRGEERRATGPRAGAGGRVET